MLIDRTQRKWAWLSLTIFVIATCSYILYAQLMPNGPHGGSVMGLIYGIIGTVFMVFAGLLAARKRVPHWRLGSAQFWLRGHLWLGTLSMPLILYHAGFGWGGLLENVLWVLFGVVYLSGFFGLFVQQFLPRFMTTRIPLETFGAQVPYQCQRMQFLSDRLVSETCGKLDIHDEPIHATFKKLAEFGATAKKADMSKWIDLAPAELRGLFLDLSTYSKQQGWVNQADNFPKMLAEIYVDLVPEEAPTKTVGKADAKAKKASPLEQMKAKKKAAGGEAGGEKKLSPLEQMKAKAAAKKKAPAEGGEEKKLSPIEQMRAKAAAKKKAAEGGDEQPEEKKLSPIEQMRAKAAAKKKKAAEGNGAKKSPLELAREQAGMDSIPADASQTINFSPEQAARLAAQAAMQQPESFDADAIPDGPIVVPCPECEHELKLPDRSLLGRKARCPLCSFKFVLELAEEPEPVAAATATSEQVSPLKQAMMQDAGGDSPGKALSPLEQMKAKAAAKKAEQGGGTATAQKPMSPIEKMRAAKAQKGGAPAAAKKKKKKAALNIPKKKKKTFTGPIPRAGELRDFYLRQIRPFLGVESRYNPQLAVDAQSKRLFNQMRSDLPGELHDTLNQLEESVDERRQFSTQTTVHHWLHWWLYLHIPLSMGMYILMIAHIIMSLIVDPQIIWG